MNKRIVILLALLNLSCTFPILGKPTRIAYLMPKGFTGGVIILYEQPDGITPETAKDGTVLYCIPKDGFLRVNTKFDINGLYIYHFYYVDDQDNLMQIEYVEPGGPNDGNIRSLRQISEEEKNTTIFAMNHRRIGFGDKNRKSIPVYSFIVSLDKVARSIYIDIDRRVSRIQEIIDKQN